MKESGEAVGSVGEALLISDLVARKDDEAVILAEAEVVLFLRGVVDLRARDELVVAEAGADVAEELLADVALIVDERVARFEDIVTVTVSMMDCCADEEAFN